MESNDTYTNNNNTHSSFEPFSRDSYPRDTRPIEPINRDSRDSFQRDIRPIEPINRGSFQPNSKTTENIHTNTHKKHTALIVVCITLVLLIGTGVILFCTGALADLNIPGITSHNSSSNNNTNKIPSSDSTDNGIIIDTNNNSDESNTDNSSSNSDDSTYSDRMDTATIDIETSGNINSSSSYTSCTISISDCDTKYEQSNLSAGIRLRGNSTTSFNKKPYRIKFDEKIQLMGLSTGESKSWVLLAEYNDTSMLRNMITYNFANRLSGIDFAPDSVYVNVTINGESKGLYLLTEQIQVNNDRVDIDESGVDNSSITDTGYLLELEASSQRRNEEGNQGADWFSVTGYAGSGNNYSDRMSMEHSDTYDIAYFVIKSDAKSSAQISYIQNYMISVYDAIYKSGDYDTINSLVDLDSAVDMYILQLITNDYDNNFSSSYVYKDAGGKLCFGPAWDFDLALGNYSGYSEYQDSVYMFHLLKDLGQYEWFTDMVSTRFAELNSGSNSPICHMLESINTYTDALSSEYNYNYELWNNSSSGNNRNNFTFDGWGNWGGGGMNHGTTYSSQEEASSALYSWISNRLNWIENSYLN